MHISVLDLKENSPLYDQLKCIHIIGPYSELLDHPIKTFDQIICNTAQLVKKVKGVRIILLFLSVNLLKHSNIGSWIITETTQSHL